jgi:hypothetical protein
MKARPMPGILLTAPDGTDLRDSLAWFRQCAPRAPAAGTRLPEARALRSERSRGFGGLARSLLVPCRRLAAVGAGDRIRA